jgi:2-polyprenyl-6-methoxyphenol hydroxylase-like FAD-dependent oxidoreductase
MEAKTMAGKTNSVNNVLIVGGGVGGLTLAIALRAAGIAVEIVDIQPHPSGSGIGIGPSGLRLLDRFGLAAKIVAEGTSSNSIFYGDAAGRPIADLAYVAKSGNGLPSNVTLTRAALSAVLLKEALAAGALLREGITVEHIAETDDHVVATLSDGSTRNVDIVVGADGAYSRVRELVFDKDLKPVFAGQGVWRWLVPNEIDLREGKTLKGSRTKLGLFPLPGNTIYAFLMLNLEENEWIDAARTTELVSDFMAEYTDPHAVAIAKTLAEAQTAIYRPLEKLFVAGDWYRGRAVLIGDAAHTMTPHLASGGVMAVEDAIVLAEELSSAPSPDAALRQFMSRRYERAKFIFETSIELSRLEQSNQSGAPDYQSIRGEALRVLAQPV